MDEYRRARREACEEVAEAVAREIARLEWLGRRREERVAAEAEISSELARRAQELASQRPRREAGPPRPEPRADSGDDWGAVRWSGEQSQAGGAFDEPPASPAAPVWMTATPRGLSMRWADRVDAALRCATLPPFPRISPHKPNFHTSLIAVCGGHSELTATQRANSSMLRRQLAEVETASISSRRSVSPTRSASSPNRSAAPGSRAAVGRWIDSASSWPLPPPSPGPVSATPPSFYVSPLTGTAVRTTPSPAASPRRPALAAAALRASRATSAPERVSSSPVPSGGGGSAVNRRRPQAFLSVDLQRPSAASSAEIRAQLQSSLRTTAMSTLSTRSLAEAAS